MHVAKTIQRPFGSSEVYMLPCTACSGLVFCFKSLKRETVRLSDTVTPKAKIALTSLLFILVIQGLCFEWSAVAMLGDVMILRPMP